MRSAFRESHWCDIAALILDVEGGNAKSLECRLSGVPTVWSAESLLLMQWTAPATGIAMCQSVVAFAGQLESVSDAVDGSFAGIATCQSVVPFYEPRMSRFGTQEKFRPLPRHVRSTPNMRHSPADAGFRADSVCFTPNMRHSGRGWECLKVTLNGRLPFYITRAQYLR